MGEIRELIDGLEDDEIMQIMFLIVNEADDTDTLSSLAKKVERGVKSEEGLKFLYFMLGRMETYEMILTAMDNLKEMAFNINSRKVVKTMYHNLLASMRKEADKYRKEPIKGV